MNGVNYETESCATFTTHLDVAKDAKASTTLSDQPHRWHISARSKEEVPNVDDLALLENDFRHIPRTKDALYGVLRKPSNGSSVVMTCWIIWSSIPFMLRRSGERVRISHSWLTCSASVRCRGDSRDNHCLHLLQNLANSRSEASSRPTARSFASK